MTYSIMVLQTFQFFMFSALAVGSLAEVNIPAFALFAASAFSNAFILFKFDRKLK